MNSYPKENAGDIIWHEYNPHISSVHFQIQFHNMMPEVFKEASSEAFHVAYHVVLMFKDNSPLRYLTLQARPDKHHLGFV